MNVQAIIAQLGKMFPSVDIAGAIQTAQKELSGVPDTMEGVQAVARRLGLNAAAVAQIYDRYGNTMAGRGVCSLLGTTPEALKKDAETILGCGKDVQPCTTMYNGVKQPPQKTTKFPRLR